MTPAERLALSERVVSGWEQMGGPTGRIADTMQMIRAEIAALTEIAGADARLGARVDDLVRRYQMVAVRMKLVHG